MNKLQGIVILCITLVVVGGGYFFYNQYSLNQIIDFDSCTTSRGSTIMYSYPPQCMARNGEIFVPDLSGEEAPDYTIPDLSGERVAPETENETTTTEASFCGGIAGIMCPPGHTCQLDGDYPDAGGVCIPDNSR